MVDVPNIANTVTSDRQEVAQSPPRIPNPRYSSDSTINNRTYPPEERGIR